MKDNYIFPAIFDYADDGISIEFPDLPGCLPCATSVAEAVTNAKEAMKLHLYGMEEDGEDIPEATPIDKITTEKNQSIILIDVYMPPFRERMHTRYVKKTLSIPSWINVEAERRGVNFSKVLQDALVEQLHLSR
ncbi:MAG: type II toxin-antitoxin system HicB family antitoxin [Ruminococcus sp.]|nr:type II toxin-antitoxin system HicB family antitoxin [Ruminococcus sp.]